MTQQTSTPLAKKLGIGPDNRVALLGAPDGFEAVLNPLPAGAVVMRSARNPVDIIVGFARTRGELRRRLNRGQELLVATGGLWLAWPKKASDLRSRLDFDTVQAAGLEAGLVDNKVCAVDETWSGLRFVVRKADRDRWVPGGRRC